MLHLLSACVIAVTLNIANAKPITSVPSRTALDAGLARQTPVEAATVVTNAAQLPWEGTLPPWGAAKRPVFELQGGADFDDNQACYLAIQSAKVVVADIATSMNQASQTAWIGAAPTISVALGGSSRDESEWQACFKQRSLQQQRPPWGNGVPPLIEIVPGPDGPSGPACQSNSKLLTEMITKAVSSISKSRDRKSGYDLSRSTIAIRGGGCVKTRFNGPADRWPYYASRGPYNTPGRAPPRQSNQPSSTWRPQPQNSPTTSWGPNWGPPPRSTQAPWGNPQPQQSSWPPQPNNWQPSTWQPSSWQPQNTWQPQNPSQPQTSWAPQPSSNPPWQQGGDLPDLSDFDGPDINGPWNGGQNSGNNGQDWNSGQGWNDQNGNNGQNWDNRPQGQWY